MKTITFYSYKGGVGRTLVVANVAKYLAQFGLRVVALDLDLEAPGLHHKFALDGGDVLHGPGVADYIAQFLTHGSPPDDLAAYVASIPPPKGGPGPIHVIPAGDAPSPAYWRALSQVDWHRLLYAPDAAGIALFDDLKARIEEQLQPDYLLIDSRTGMTEMGGIATTILADVVVTLTLNTREHLEGIRSIMRSINKTRRSNGDEPVQLEVALSRLPPSSDHEEDIQRARKSALAFLNEEAPDPTETLTLDEILVLHTEPSLQEREHLLIGSELGGDGEQVLLTDYLRLFARFIPLPSLAPRVQQLVKVAMDRLLDDPLSTERELQVLARYTGHPDALRALIRFYRVRQDYRRMLDASAQLWDITGKDDLDLVWTAVREGFEETYRYQAEHVPLDLVWSAWTAEGEEDVDVGLRLSRTLDNFGREEDAVRVAEALFRHHPDNELVAEAVVQHLASAGQHPEAADFALEHADEFAYDADYLTLWANAVAELSDRTSAISFLEDGRVDLELLRRRSPAAVVRVLQIAGREAEVTGLLDLALDEAASNRDYNSLFMLAQAFAQRGPSAQRQFETTLQNRLPDVADRFLDDVRRANIEWRSVRTLRA
jgi:MinD-like ATPase involved in chromosome partitioning or flagellar assembly